MKNGDLTIKNGELNIKHSDLTMKQWFFLHAGKLGIHPAEMII
jgi:hypothetical protein